MKLLGNEHGKPIRVGEEVLLQTESGLTVKKISTPESAARACRGTKWSLFDQKIAQAYLQSDALYLIRDKEHGKKYMMHSKVGLVLADDTFPNSVEVRSVMQEIEGSIEDRKEPSIDSLRSAMNHAEKLNVERHSVQTSSPQKQSSPSASM